MAMQRQLRILKTNTDDDQQAQEGSLIKVAFATSDLKRVDQHFGSSERFAIFLLGPQQADLLEVAEFGKLRQDGNENKLLEKFVLLDGCAAVYSLAIGPSAVRQLLGLGIQPIRVAEKAPITRLIEEIQEQLVNDPNNWASRALARKKEKTPDRFEMMESEGWEE